MIEKWMCEYCKQEMDVKFKSFHLRACAFAIEVFQREIDKELSTMSNDTCKVTVEFRDGSEEKFTYVGIVVVKDGVLTLHSGFYNSYIMERRHLGSWPLDTVKKWTESPE